MSQLEEYLKEFKDRNLQLLKKVREYTIPLDNIDVLQAVAWEVQFAVPNLPFSMAMHRLEPELEQLLESLNKTISGDAAPDLINKVYDFVRPAFRVREEKNEHYRNDGFVPGDPISYFLNYQQTMVLAYRNSGALIIGNPYQDYFLRTLFGNGIAKHKLLGKEELENASNEIKEYAKEFLRTMQRMASVDVDSIFQDYYNLLLDMHKKLESHTKNIVTYEGIEPRRLGSTKVGVVSSFVSSLLPHLGVLNQSLEGDVNEFISTNGEDEKTLLLQMAISKDWGDLLPKIIKYNHLKSMDPIDKYRFFEPGDRDLVPITNLEKCVADYIVGQEENVGRLRNLLNAFVQGRQIPNVLLYGPTGAGKTLTMKSLVNEIEGLRMVLLNSGYLHFLGDYAEMMSQRPWHTILYIDDIQFSFEQMQGFKTGTQGMKEFPKNVAIIASANPESLDGIPESVRRRFPVRLKYKNPNLDDESVRESIFKANCAKLGIEYLPHMVTDFIQINSGKLKSLSPVTVYDYLVEAKALHF